MVGFNTFEDDLLLPMTKVSLNPAVNVSSDPIKVQFVEQSGMGYFVEGFLEVEEDHVNLTGPLLSRISNVTTGKG